MAVKTHIEPARTRVQSEQEAIEAKFTAFETFRTRVEELPSEGSPSSFSGAIAAVGSYSRCGNTHDDRCRAVRTAFAETVRPHSVNELDESEPILTTIRTELNDSVALALASTSHSPFSKELKHAIIDEVRARQTQLTVMNRALIREVAVLEDAAQIVDDVTDWITAKEERRLTDVGFDDLRYRHERLAVYRDRCEELVGERQALLRETTREKADAGIRNWNLVQYLYSEFPVTFPILTTLLRLHETCSSCQRSIRDHLVRRV